MNWSLPAEIMVAKSIIVSTFHKCIVAAFQEKVRCPVKAGLLQHCLTNSSSVCVTIFCKTVFWSYKRNAIMCSCGCFGSWEGTGWWGRGLYHSPDQERVPAEFSNHLKIVRANMFSGIFSLARSILLGLEFVLSHALHCPLLEHRAFPYLSHNTFLWMAQDSCTWTLILFGVSHMCLHFCKDLVYKQIALSSVQTIKQIRLLNEINSLKEQCRGHNFVNSNGKCGTVVHSV